MLHLLRSLSWENQRRIHLRRRSKQPNKNPSRRLKSRVEKSARRTVTTSPKVGIFWLVKGKLIFDSTPLADAEPYGDCKGHSRGHLKHWTQLQRDGIVPRDVEYEVNPRGRV